MALPYLTVVLTIVLFNLGSSRQQAHTSVCEYQYDGCVGFLNKQDNFSSFRQCLKSCNFKKVPGAKSLRGYSCTDYTKPCYPLTFYQIQSSTNAFFEWTKCLEVCHLLTNEDGQASASGEICMQPHYDCFTFANSKQTIDKFVKCYIDCQVTRTENHTHMNYMYMCRPHHQECIDSIFFTLPEEDEPQEILTKCYKDCGIAEAAPEPESGGFRCDEDSKTCVPCTDEDGKCSDLSACQETCGKETAPEPESGGFRCDEDSKTCVPCTDEDGKCSDLSACQETCGKETPEPESGGFRCDEDSKTCVPCTDEDGKCSDLSACQETCGEEIDGADDTTYKCDEDSKTCITCTDKDETCWDFYTCDQNCQDES